MTSDNFCLYFAFTFLFIAFGFLLTGMLYEALVSASIMFIPYLLIGIFK